jgi:hypothetical protein
MTTPLTPLPARRADLVIRPFGAVGEHVVKDPRSGAYLRLGEQEHHLLLQLDGRAGECDVREAFGRRFGVGLSSGELEEFLTLARGMGLLDDATGGETERPGRSRRPTQSVLCWRWPLLDPDSLLTWIEPKVRFAWTGWFPAASAACIAASCAVALSDASQLIESLRDAWRWQSAPALWLTVLVVTALHEAAHGLTCKHFGGEVRDVGVLLLLLMPCVYCNVSDSWLFREKSKRMWVMLAGGWFELILWALAVLAWRITPPASLGHQVAFLVLSVTGVQTLFNFNPLVKLDGYYLLSDWLEIPNLQARASRCVVEHVRALLGLAASAPAEPRAALLLGYGAASLAYSVAFLGLLVVGMVQATGTVWGWIGLASAFLLLLVAAAGAVRAVRASGASASPRAVAA